MTSALAQSPAPPARKFRFGATATVPIPKAVYYPLVAMLVLFIGGNTFESAPTLAMGALKWVPLGILLLTSFLALGGRRIPHCPPVLFFALMALLLLASLGSFFGFQPGQGTFELLSTVVVIATAYVTAAVLVVTDSRRAFFDLIAIIGRVILLAATLFYIAGINLGRGSGLSAWTDNSNTLASMLAPGMVVFIAGCIERRPGWLRWHLPFLLLSIPMIAVTDGRASFVWVGFGLLMFWLYRRGSWLTLIAFLGGFILLIAFWGPLTAAIAHWTQIDISPRRMTSAGPLSGREEVWRIGWSLFKERSTFGYGFGSSKTLLAEESWRFVRHQGLHFHSSYLTSLVETGIFGFIAFMTVLLATITRGIADGSRTRALPRESWPTAALPLIMVFGALGHAIFESWLLSAGNVNTPLFWICVWLVHFQAQIPIRAVPQGRTPAARAATPLPAQ